MSIHVLVVPERKAYERPDGHPRWCFACRDIQAFTFQVRTPTDEMSYYGPRCEVRCLAGHTDGDLFPGRWREWSDE